MLSSASTLNQINHGRTIWATVSEIAYEDEPPVIRVRPIVFVAQMVHQRQECVYFAMYVPDDIDWPVEEWLDERVSHGLQDSQWVLMDGV